jgi:glucokinase
VFATELGNAKSFNNYLREVFAIDDQNNFPVLESFLSGTGIAKIYQAKSGLLKTSEEIVDSYGSDDLATDMLNNFGKSMGRVLADLSLTSMATGGIYFAGSLMRALSQLDVITALKDEFDDHSSEHHQSILKNISINLITKPHTPLYGNLNYSIVRRLHE